jgi:hypothetical protein
VQNNRNAVDVSFKITAGVGSRKFRLERKKSMNQNQIKYAMERVNQIAIAKVAAIKEACKLPPPARITYGQLLSLFKKGKVALKYSEERIVESSHSLCYAFNLDEYTKYSSEEIDDKKYSTQSAAFWKKSKEIKDKLMLGDAEDALKMIQDFDK